MKLVVQSEVLTEKAAMIRKIWVVLVCAWVHSTLLGIVPPRATGQGFEPHIKGDIVITLGSGATMRVDSVEPWPQGLLRIIRGGGTEELFLSIHAVARIIDASGEDRTTYVIDRRERLGPHYDRINPEQRPSRDICFKGGPLPGCRSFFLTEVGLNYRLDDGPGRSTGETVYVTTDFGWARNLGERFATGATFFGGFGADRTRYGIRARIRRWLEPSLSVELSPGLLLGGTDDPSDPDLPGFLCGLTVNKADLLSIGGHVEIIQLRFDTSDKTDVAWYLGAKAGSYPGLAVSLLSGILALLWVGAAS